MLIYTKDFPMAKMKLRNWFLSLAFLALILSPQQAGAQADYSQNFDALPVGSDVKGWVGSLSKGWTGPAHFLVTAGGASSSHAFGQATGTNLLMLYTDGVPQATSEMRWSETTVGTSGSFIGGAARFDAIGANGYIVDVLYNPTGLTVYFDKVISGTRKDIGKGGRQLAISGMAPGVKILQHFKITGTTLSYDACLAGGSTPAATSLTDSSLSSAGYYGFFVSGKAGMEVDDVWLAGAKSNRDPQAISIGNSNIFYSPGNWFSNGTGAMTANNIHGSASGTSSSTFIQTQNQGAYLKTVFGGTSLSISFDPEPLKEGKVPIQEWPVLRYYIDGKGTDVQVPPTGNSLTLATGLVSGNHTLTLYTLRLKQSGDKWGADGKSPADVFRLTGLKLDDGASLFTPGLMPGRALYYGDSITDGVRALGMDADFAGMDGAVTAAQLVAQSLNCEVGIIGFGGQAWIHGGSGKVPGFLSSWNFYHNTMPRDFSQPLDYILENEGANGGSSPANTSNWVTAVRALGTTGADGMPTKIICISAFRNGNGADLSTYKADHPSDDRVFSVDGTAANNGLLSDERFSLDNLHPTKEGHIWLSSRLAVLIHDELNGNNAAKNNGK